MPKRQVMEELTPVERLTEFAVPMNGVFNVENGTILFTLGDEDTEALLENGKLILLDPEYPEMDIILSKN